MRIILKLLGINQNIFKLMQQEEISLLTQNKINQMYISNIFLGKTNDNSYVFQSTIIL